MLRGVLGTRSHSSQLRMVMPATQVELSTVAHGQGHLGLKMARLGTSTETSQEEEGGAGARGKRRGGEGG